MKKKIILIISRLILGGVFIYASIDKIVDPMGFAGIVKKYEILPDFMIIGVATILPWIELILGIFLIIGIFVRFSATVLSTSLVVFMILIGIKSLNGTIENCGCFPSSSIFSSSNIIFLLSRDVLFLLFGLIIIFPTRIIK